MDMSPGSAAHITASVLNTDNANAAAATNRDDMIVYYPVNTGVGVLAPAFGVDSAQEHLMCVTKLKRPPVLVCPEGQSGCRYLCVRIPSSSSDEAVEGRDSGMCSKRSLRRVDIVCELSYGEIIKQHLHKLTRASARTTNVTGAVLQRPAWFKHANGSLGIPLRIVLNRYELESVLENADRSITFGEGVTKFVTVHVQGKQPFQRQIRIDQQPFTRADLLRRIASVMAQLFKENDGNRYCDNVVQSEIILLGCAHVSRGHLQPIFSVRRSHGDRLSALAVMPRRFSTY